MGHTVCHGICERVALRVTSKSRNFGKLKRFANFDKGEMKCRFCAAVYPESMNIIRCPCCGIKLAIRRLHGRTPLRESLLVRH